MSINFAKLVNKNFVKNKNIKYFINKKIYFFLLGFSIAVGEIDIVLLTAIFILTLKLNYKIQYQYLSSYFHKFIKYLNPEYRQLFYSIILAGGFSLGSYLILNIWSELDNKWLALGIICQVILSGTGLLFLTNIMLKNKHYDSSINNDKNQLEVIVNQLDSPSPLKRLWAVNQIILQWHHQRFTPEEYKQIQDYLTIVRELETEPIILNKIDEYFRLISPVLSQPLHLPVKSFVSEKKKLKVNH